MTKCISLVSSVLLRVSQYYFLAIGLTSVYIDLGKRRICRSRYLTLYTNCVNVFTVVTLPAAVGYYYIEMNALRSNSVMRLTNIAGTLIDSTIILLSMLLRRKRDVRFQIMMQDFFQLDVDYFDQLPTDWYIQYSFDWKIVLKISTTVGQMVAVVFAMLHLVKVVNVYSILAAVFYANTLYLLHGLVFQYSAVLWHASKRYALLNAQLAQLLAQARVSTPTADQERAVVAHLHLMAEVHWRLLRIVRRECNHYIMQITGALLTHAMHAIAFGYYLVLILDGLLDVDLSFVEVIFAWISYSLFFADLFLFYNLCEKTTSTYQHTGELLKDFRTGPFVCGELERTCETFSLQLMQQKLYISMGGLYKLNTQALLIFSAFIIRYTIILIQSDWEDR